MKLVYEYFSGGGSRGKLVLGKRRREVVSCEEELVARVQL
jgi:hypothetical protein